MILVESPNAKHWKYMLQTTVIYNGTLIFTRRLMYVVCDVVVDLGAGEDED